MIAVESGVTMRHRPDASGDLVGQCERDLCCGLAGPATPVPVLQAIERLILSLPPRRWVVDVRWLLSPANRSAESQRTSSGSVGRLWRHLLVSVTAIKLRDAFCSFA